VSPKASRRLVYIAFASITGLYVFAIVFAVVVTAMGDKAGAGDLTFSLLTFTFPLVGFLICRRQPQNTVGWILLVIGFGWIAPSLFDAYGHWALVTRPGSLPGGAVAVALVSWTWIPPVGLMGTYLLLLFPNGKLLSPRWRIVGWVSAFAMVGGALGILFSEADLGEEGFPGLQNPLHIPSLAGIIEILVICIPLIALCIVASAVSLVMRFRRSSGLERLQLKWLTAAASILGALYAVAIVASFSNAWGLPTAPLWVRVIQQLASMSFFLIPISIGIAILRHRLFDIDIVVNKALVYGVLAAFISLVYVGVVVGIGTLVGAGGELNLGLSLAATAIVAVAFQPIREFAQRLANRIVYGERVSPYEAVTTFSHQISESLSFDEVLPRMAEAAARGVNGTKSRVALFLPNGGKRSVSWPDDSPSNEYDRTLAVTYKDEAVGEISVAKPPGEQLTTGDDRLLADLASQAALAMSNLRLTAELGQKLVEIEKSRSRIIAAQDSERQRMERDINERAQKQLVAITDKLGAVRSVLETDPTNAEVLLDELKQQTGQVVESVRDLARGIFPPLLADRGLKAALESLIQKMGLAAELRMDSPDARYGREAESAVYFCIREALADAAQRAPSEPIVVRITQEDASLVFEVSDQGSGSNSAGGNGALQNMADRLEALGGDLRIEEGARGGNVVTGTLVTQRLLSELVT
jgi:signal transduction histidine kinase